jgi:4-hydroxy-3-polyprenylbenzoate decarboxylase
MQTPQTVTVALTGASGLPYGLRLIDTLISAGVRVWVLYSQAAQVVAKQEMDLQLPRALPKLHNGCNSARRTEGQLAVFGREEWFAPVASGSNPADAMVVCPCSMGTLAAIAHGMSDNLIERAADVSIKEGRKLILVPRETPLRSFTWKTCSSWHGWAWSSCRRHPVFIPIHHRRHGGFRGRPHTGPATHSQ